jgi:hypothetical protein
MLKKGQCHEIFASGFFHGSFSPTHALEKSMLTVLSISVITVLIEDFFHLPPVSKTPVVHLELRISANFRKNSKRP